MNKKNEMRTSFEQRLQSLQFAHELLVSRANKKEETGNGVYDRYRYPVLTAQHTPLTWRYDLNFASNPRLMERFGINAVLNAGAIKMDGKYLVVQCHPDRMLWIFSVKDGQARDTGERVRLPGMPSSLRASP